MRPPQPANPKYTPPTTPRHTPPPRRRFRGPLAGTAAVVVVLGCLAVAGWREHWPPAVFGKAAAQALTWRAVQAPLPADAAQTSSQNAGLYDVACPSVRNCVAIGNYATNNTGGNNGNTVGLVETLSGGTWTPTELRITVPDPSQVTYVNVDGIACTAVGACVAVGAYNDLQDNQSPLVETLSGGSWTSAVPPLPGDANHKDAFLSQVACPAQDTCVATGWYEDQSGDSQPLIETLSGGTWTAQKAPLPAGAVARKPNSSDLATGLFLLKCPTAGNCVATGDYASQDGGTQGLIDTLSGGTWTSQMAPLPSDAAANPVANLLAIACPAPGACLAAGRYTARDGRGRFLTETQSGGTWTPGTAPLPADAAGNQKWSISQVTGFTAAACTAPGTCVAAGSYFLTDNTVQGVIDTLSGGTWTSARAPVPAGAASAKQYIYLDSAACPAAGDCLAVGGYKVQDGSSQALIETATPKAGSG